MPNYYGPNQYYPQNYYQMPQFQPQQQSQPQQQQIQNGGFVSVRNEAEARSYPVAPGNSVTFKDETAPYVYTKTMGFSQLDRPIFEKYKLIKEEVADASEVPQNASKASEIGISMVSGLEAEIKAIWSEIEALKENAAPAPQKKTISKKEKDGDE